MSLPDSAEYWWNVKGYNRRAEHECRPRGGEKGTPNRFNCPVCGKSFRKDKYWRIKLDGSEMVETSGVGVRLTRDQRLEVLIVGVGG